MLRRAPPRLADIEKMQVKSQKQTAQLCDMLFAAQRGEATRTVETAACLCPRGETPPVATSSPGRGSASAPAGSAHSREPAHTAEWRAFSGSVSAVRHGRRLSPRCRPPGGDGLHYMHRMHRMHRIHHIHCMHCKHTSHTRIESHSIALHFT